MHDIKLIRENPEAFDAALARRGHASASAEILEPDNAIRSIQPKLEAAQAQANSTAKAIGVAIAKGDVETADRLKALVSDAKVTIPQFQQELRVLNERFKYLLAGYPNLPDPEVPDGTDESQNVEVSCWGAPRSFNFAPKEHADLGPALGLDFETGALISGARFTFLRGQMARLQRALGQFMLDIQTIKNGHTECAPPLLVRNDSMIGTGQLPKFANDQFSAADMNGRNQLLDKALPADFEGRMAVVQSGQFRKAIDKMLDDAPTYEQFWLIPTAEVSLTNSVREQILDAATLPIRLTALTPCFRSEAGAAGKDTRGYIRQHQFEKVELVTICKPEDSPAEHERMVAAAESILQALELPYRKMLLCAGDMGFTARKTFDLEVWLPGQDTYREISSVSNCGDFQARRMNTRYRPEGAKGTEFVHTLNGSGLAVGRTLVAVLENYQQEDGSVTVPEALKPYMGGIEALVPA